MDLIKVGEFEKVAGELVVSMTDGLDEIITGLEGEFDIANIPADLSDSENYKLVQKALREIKKPRIQLEKDRKAIKAIPLAIGKKIDAAPKPYFARVEKLESAWKKAKDDYDDEQARIAAEKAAELQRVQDEILANIEEIQQAPFELWNLTSDEVLVKLTELEKDNLEWAGCMIDRATSVKVDAIARVKTMYDNKVAQEQAEAEKAEREAKEQAEREKREAEEAKRAEEERKRLEKEAEKARKVEEENRALREALAQKEREAQEEKERAERAENEAKEQAERQKRMGEEEARVAEEKRIAEEERLKREAEEKERLAKEANERAGRIAKDKIELVRFICDYFCLDDSVVCISFVDDIYAGNIKGLRIDQ